MSTSLCTTLRNTLMNALTTAAGSTAYLWFWTGSGPAKSSNNFVAPTGTALAIFSLPNPIAPNAVVGVDTLSAITNVTGLASGTPGYYRVTSGGPVTLTQAAYSGGSVTYTGTGITSGLTSGSVYITGFTNAGNNGVFPITSSTTTTIVATNAGGVNETHAGTAVLDQLTDVQWQGSAGVGSGDFNFASTIASGGTVGITSATYTDGNA